MTGIEQKIPNLVPGDNVIGDSAKSHLTCINGISPVLKADYFGPFYNCSTNFSATKNVRTFHFGWYANITSDVSSILFLPCFSTFS